MNINQVNQSFLATHHVLLMEQAAHKAASAAHMKVMDRAPDSPNEPTKPCGRCRGKCILPQFAHRIHLGVPGGCYSCDCRGTKLTADAEKKFKTWAERAELARLRVLWKGLNEALKYGQAHGAMAEHIEGLKASLASIEKQGLALNKKIGVAA